MHSTDQQRMHSSSDMQNHAKQTQKTGKISQNGLVFPYLPEMVANFILIYIYMIYLIHVTEKRVGKATILAIHKPAQVHAVAWSNDIHPFVLQDADLSKADVQDRFGYFIAGCFANCIILGN
jgi:hypothetical protein